MTKTELKSLTAAMREALRLGQQTIDMDHCSSVHGSIDRLDDLISRCYGTKNETLRDLAKDARKMVKTLDAMLDFAREPSPEVMAALASVSTAVAH